MSWTVYGGDGQTVRCVLHTLEYGGEHMGERKVTASVDAASVIGFEAGDYLTFRGERFEVDMGASVSKRSAYSYVHEVVFVPMQYELERVSMRNMFSYGGTSSSGSFYASPLSFSFFGNVSDFCARIKACMDDYHSGDAGYQSDPWTFDTSGASDPDKVLNIVLNEVSCWNALAMVNTSFGETFTVSGRTVTVGAGPEIQTVLEYGRGKGLYSIERTVSSDKAVVTRVRAYGSDRNLDNSYKRLPSWTGSRLQADYVISPLRLMLPGFERQPTQEHPEYGRDYMDAPQAMVDAYGIREATITYDDIYPSIAGVSKGGQRIDVLRTVETISGYPETFAVHTYDLGFSLEENLSSANAQVAMKSGQLQGYAFNISEIELESTQAEVSGGIYKYRLVLACVSTESSDVGTSTYSIPNATVKPSAGDEFVLLGILMPIELVKAAEERLADRVEEYFDEYGSTVFGYAVSLDDQLLHGSQPLASQLREGSRMRIRDTDLGVSGDDGIVIRSLTVRCEDGGIPSYSVVLDNSTEAGRLSRIQGQLEETATTVNATYNTQSELMRQYRRKLDKSLFDSLFEIHYDGGTGLVSSVEVKHDFFSSGAVSALGQSGGGGGTQQALYALADVLGDAVSARVKRADGTLASAGDVLTLASVEGVLRWVASVSQGGGGTVTGAVMNGAAVQLLGGVLQLGTVLTQHQSLSAYRTASSQDLIDAEKQGVIGDLATIRTNAGNGSTAYGWGNHATAGYIHAAGDTVTGYLDFTLYNSPYRSIVFREILSQSGAGGYAPIYIHIRSDRAYDNLKMGIGSYWTKRSAQGEAEFVYFFIGKTYDSQTALRIYPDRVAVGENTVFHEGHVERLVAKHIGYPNKGILVRLGSVRGTMYNVSVYGNSYNRSKKPIYTEIQFYDYDENGGILSASCKHYGEGLGTVSVFRLDGTACVYFRQTASFQTFFVYARSNKTVNNAVTEISDSDFPESGVTFRVDITPCVAYDTWNCNKNTIPWTCSTITSAGTATVGSLASNGNATVRGTATVGNLASNGNATVSGAATVGSLDCNGNATVSGTATVGNLASNGYVTAMAQYSASDGRMKDIVGDAGLTVDGIADAPAVLFRWKGSDSLPVQAGSIAQYWEDVLPQCVNDSGGGLTMDYGAASIVSVVTLARAMRSMSEEMARMREEIGVLRRMCDGKKDMTEWDGTELR